MQGAVVIGESAGANALSHSCYGLDAQKVLWPYGPVPFRTIVHWEDYGDYDKDNWAQFKKEMEELSDDKRLQLIGGNDYVRHTG